MATKNTGYLTNGGSNQDAATLTNGGSTDGDSLGAWVAGALLFSASQSSGSTQDLKLTIEVSPDGSEWFYWRTVTVLDLASGGSATRSVPLGSNGDVGDRMFVEYIRVTNETGVDITLTARYSTLV